MAPANGEKFYEAERMKVISHLVLAPTVDMCHFR